MFSCRGADVEWGSLPRLPVACMESLGGSVGCGTLCRGPLGQARDRFWTVRSVPAPPRPQCRNM